MLPIYDQEESYYDQIGISNNKNSMNLLHYYNFQNKKNLSRTLQ